MSIISGVHLARGVAIWLEGWSAASNAVATDNARSAATACSRRRVEREEAARYLALRARPPVVVADGASRAGGGTH